MRRHAPVTAPIALAIALVIALAGPAQAQTCPRPLVLELFTSQGCSSCPPADALVATLARTRPDLLALTFHVTYWNRLGWTDPFSLDDATERQRRYTSLGVSANPYTPELVVDGRIDAVGSDPQAVADAIGRARPADKVALSVRRDGDALLVSVGAGVGSAARSGTLALIGFDREHLTAVTRGENTGRNLREANVVRSIAELGPWRGDPVRLRVPVPAGERAAALLQAADGAVLGAAVEPAASVPSGCRD